MAQLIYGLFKRYVVLSGALCRKMLKGIEMFDQQNAFVVRSVAYLFCLNGDDWACVYSFCNLHSPLQVVTEEW